MQERRPDGASVYRIDDDLRVVLATMRGHWRNRLRLAPGMPAIVRTLNQHMQITFFAGGLSGDIVVLVERIEMSEAVGGQRWLPVVPSGETEAHLCGERVVGGGSGGSGKGARPTRGQGKDQASAYNRDTQAEHDKTFDRGTHGVLPCSHPVRAQCVHTTDRTCAPFSHAMYEWSSDPTTGHGWPKRLRESRNTMM